MLILICKDRWERVGEEKKGFEPTMGLRRGHFFLDQVAVPHRPQLYRRFSRRIWSIPHDLAPNPSDFRLLQHRAYATDGRYTVARLNY
jgi:hypothetical protein